MAATIKGVVFKDINHNGIYEDGEPGISGVYIVLYSVSGGCVTTNTDVDGNYSFSVNTATTYTIYETVTDMNLACPPVDFTQPDDFTVSNGPRNRKVTVTANNINNNASLTGYNFSHDTTDAPLTCNTTMIQFIGKPSVWYDINIVTGSSAIRGALSPAEYINGIGYNPFDNYLYGYSQTSNVVARIDNNCNVTLLESINGLPPNDYNVGCVGINGLLYLYQGGATRFYTIDLRPDSATYLKLVNPNTLVEQTANYGTAINNATALADWDYHDGFLYGVYQNGVVYRLNPANGNFISLTTKAPNFGSSVGAVAFDFSGTLYAIVNGDGSVYKYTISGTTASAVKFSASIPGTYNDGAMCKYATINVDFGDAPDAGASNGPDNYNTLLAQNGPRHGLINKLMLGTQVTAESDAYQDQNAEGDDISKGIPDDGLVTPLPKIVINQTSYSLIVNYTNETGSSANLYGWVDFNKNGIFEGRECNTVVVPSGTGMKTTTLNFTVPDDVTLTAGHTFVRLRLTTQTLINNNLMPDQEDTRSIGGAIDGEVEDYIVTIGGGADVMVSKSSMPYIFINESEVTYTIVVTNNGPDTAENVEVTDNIPVEIEEPQYSIDQGLTYNPWPGSLNLSTMLSGESVEIIITGTVSASAIGSAKNIVTVTTTTYDPNMLNNTAFVTNQIFEEPVRGCLFI